jgi:hypothetical protein
MKTTKRTFLILLPLLLALIVSSCCFDIARVKQMPVRFAPTSERSGGFVLEREVEASLGTTYLTCLKPGTRWQPVGETEFGTVFSTTDQIVTVQASNIHEAQLVVSNRVITGFYLPVEKKFAPVRNPIPIETKSLD